MHALEVDKLEKEHTKLASNSVFDSKELIEMMKLCISVLHMSNLHSSQWLQKVNPHAEVVKIHNCCIMAIIGALFTLNRIDEVIHETNKYNLTQK